MTTTTTNVDLSSLWGNTTPALDPSNEPQPAPLPKKPKKKASKEKPLLNLSFSDDYAYEIGIDEAGRGPMFGRLYVAGVVLPKDGSFDLTDIKDSKKFTSKTKIRDVAKYIKTHAVSYYIHYVEPDVIDKINIRQAVLKSMRECAKQNIDHLETVSYNGNYKHKYFLMVDGNDFTPYSRFNETTNTLETIPHDTFVGGDHTYAAIAAASILAKVARDDYILALCDTHPKLSEVYGIDSHMGYGTKKHLEAIRTHGVTQFHRKTYGSCKDQPLYEV